MTKSIKHWLAGKRDFNVGVALYKVYGNDERIIEMLDQGHSAFRQNKLVQVMTELEKSQVSVSAIPEVAAPQYAAVNLGTYQLPENKVPEAKDIYKSEWLPIYSEMNHLRARLLDFPDDVSRGKACFKILELQRKCESIWLRRDYHNRTGKVMPVNDNPEVIVDPNQLQKKLNNLRGYITKARNIIKDDPENEKAAIRLANYETERDSILKQLKEYEEKTN